MQHLQISEHETEITELAIQTVIQQLSINAQNRGKEFYRQPYDLALHIIYALKTKGFKISVIPFQSIELEREELARIRATLKHIDRESEHMPGKKQVKLGAFTQIDPLPANLLRRIIE